MFSYLTTHFWHAKLTLLTEVLLCQSQYYDLLTFTHAKVTETVAGLDIKKSIFV